MICIYMLISVKFIIILLSFNLIKEIIIDTSKFNSGVYTIEVETSQGKTSKKLIIE